MWFFEQGNPCGWFSWQHLLVCGIAWALLIFFAIFFGIRDRKHFVTLSHNKFLIACAILIWVGELSKYIVVIVFRGFSAMLEVLPLFLCSLQLFTLPLICITRGNFQKSMADLTFVFGVVGAISGTFIGTEFTHNYAFSFFPLVSVFTHSVSGCASLYIGIAKLFTLSKETVWITPLTLSIFSCFAWIGSAYTPQNYMFLQNADGTPFAILYNIFNGNKILYPISIIILQILFLLFFYIVVYLIRKCIQRKKSKV